jgi:hypothetical protein
MHAHDPLAEFVVSNLPQATGSCLKTGYTETPFKKLSFVTCVANYTWSFTCLVSNSLVFHRIFLPRPADSLATHWRLRSQKE